MLVQLIGWIGAAFVLLGYTLVSLKKIPPDGDYFHLANLLGGVALSVVAVATSNWPQLTVEVIWALVALYFILARRMNKKRNSSDAGLSVN